MAGAFAVAATPSFAAGITQTSDGFTYFYKTGAGLAAHDTAVLECRTVSERLHQPAHPTPGMGVSIPNVSPLAAGLGGAIGMMIVAGVEQKMADARGHPVNLENCMVARGWQVVAVD